MNLTRRALTQFVEAHMAERPEDLGYLGSLLDRCSNLLIDMSARVAELGRQPYSAKRFFMNYADRLLFGTDLPSVEMYRAHFRFLETADEYFGYPSQASRQGRWNIHGLDLPDDVLEKINRNNAIRLWKS
jgi:predicted TIM-barrel fold metal-dependent hydrolase